MEKFLMLSIVAGLFAIGDILGGQAIISVYCIDGISCFVHDWSHTF